MKKRKLDNWIQSYMSYTSHNESPDKFHFWTAVSTIAGALRRQVWIDCAYWDWVPNFYIVLVAPPGVVAKSTSASIGMGLLKEVDKINFGPSALTWQYLIQELAASKQTFFDDKNILRHQSAITLAISELGTFLDPTNREMVDALVDLWDGQRGEWKKGTVSQGAEKVINPWINFIGCTTPAWISDAFPDYMIGGGFTSRMIFVYADKKRKYIAYPKRAVDASVLALKSHLVDDLKEIALMAGEYKLTDEATEFGTEWYMSFHKNRPKHLDNEQFEGYIARKQTHIHKLAMILSAAQNNNLMIEKTELAAAVEIVTALEADMPKVFGRIGLSKHSKHSTMVLRIIRTHHEITGTDLYKLVYKHISQSEFQEAVDSLKQAGQIKIKMKGKDYFLTFSGSSEEGPK